MSGEAKTGQVKWFHLEKGFGFIAPDNEGAEVFVHASAVQGHDVSPLTEGGCVEFEIETPPRMKPQAVNVRRITR